MSVQQQIEKALLAYIEGQMASLKKTTRMDGNEFALMLGAAFLSGISLTSRFLAANDGSAEITPQLIERAVHEVAKGAGFTPDKL